MINDVGINQVEEELVNISEFGLTKIQIKNINEKMGKHIFSSNEEELLILKYACMIKCIINDYVNISVPFNKRKLYKRFVNNKYSIRRVLFTINEESSIEPIYIDDELERQVQSLLIELKLFKNAKIKKMKEPRL